MEKPALSKLVKEQRRKMIVALVEFTCHQSAEGQLLEFSCLIRRRYDDKQVK